MLYKSVKFEQTFKGILTSYYALRKCWFPGFLMICTYYKCLNWKELQMWMNLFDSNKYKIHKSVSLRFYYDAILKNRKFSIRCKIS